MNYFDDYVFYGYTAAYAATGSTSNRTKGLATANSINILGSPNRLLTVIYYDQEGRMVESIADNHLSGTDRIRNTYSFASELLSSVRSHTVAAVSTTIVSSYEYDHIGRKLTSKSSINALGDGLA